MKCPSEVTGYAGYDVGGAVYDVGPGEPQYRPTKADEFVLPFAVAEECLGAAVR
jgi:hypothetical protein